MILTCPILGPSAGLATMQVTAHDGVFGTHNPQACARRCVELDVLPTALVGG